MKIRREDVKDAIIEAVKAAESDQGFYSGWGIPILINDDGTLSVGSWLSNSTWIPDKEELIRVARWNVDENSDYEYDVNFSREDAVYADMWDIVEHYLTVVDSNDKEFEILSDLYERPWELE